MALLCLCLPLGAQIPPVPNPPRLVNDLAGIFTAAQTAALERDLVAFDDSTSNQLVVLTVSDLEGYDPNLFAYEVLSRWGVGGAKHDNGLVLLVKPKVGNASGRVAISVGYGLEGRVTDAACKRIIETRLIPHFREDDYFGGVWDAVQALKDLAQAEYHEGSGGEEDTGAMALGIVFFAFILFLIFLSIKGNSGRKGGGRNGSSGKDLAGEVGKAILWSTLSGGGRSSGGFSGGSRGGFGGFGGGRGGGGGASGSW